jgi:hypothetical protein
MSGFDAGWLALREPFDAAARDGALAARFIEAVVDRAALRNRVPSASKLVSWRPQACRLVDLAAGTGSNLRVLAPLLPGDQDWLLVDHDPELIAAQARELGRWAASRGWQCSVAEGGLVIDTGHAQWRVRARRLDLQGSFDQLQLASFDGVTTTAFLDLVSKAWLERLADRIVAAAVPLLATLTVDGRREWLPACDGDRAIAAAFERHQQGDKGFGASLGIAAADSLRAMLDARGCFTGITQSDWRVDRDGGAQGQAMLLRMVDESATVAREVDPAAAGTFDDWAALRSSQVSAGALSLRVGHRDLLALPGRQAA